MTSTQQQLLSDLDEQKISLETFHQKFGIDLSTNTSFIKEEIQQALQKKKPSYIDLCIHLLYLSDDITRFVDELNEVLISPYHTSHQEICMSIQKIGHPSSIPYIKSILQGGFEHLAYTCSEDAAIAKWFSWALFSIGTPEAIQVIEEFTHSENMAIREEMNYRLAKVNQDPNQQ